MIHGLPPYVGVLSTGYAGFLSPVRREGSPIFLKKKVLSQIAIASCNSFQKNRKKLKKGIDKRERICYNIKVVNRRHNAGMAQSVEHVIGNDEVISSILITSSR